MQGIYKKTFVQKDTENRHEQAIAAEAYHPADNLSKNSVTSI